MFRSIGCYQNGALGANSSRLTNLGITLGSPGSLGAQLANKATHHENSSPHQSQRGGFRNCRSGDAGEFTTRSAIVSRHRARCEMRGIGFDN